jgi:hypothetical protein
MLAKIKPFDKGYANHDKFAKKVYVSWRNQSSQRVKVNPDTYGVDILSLVPGEAYAELSVCTDWMSTKKYPYDEVKVYWRKYKSLGWALETGNALNFWVISVDGKKAYKVPSDYLLSHMDDLNSEWNDKLQGSDYYWSIPKNRLLVFSLEGQAW